VGGPKARKSRALIGIIRQNRTTSDTFTVHIEIECPQALQVWAGCKQSVPRCHYGRPTKKAPRRSAGPRIHSRSQHAQRGARGKIVFVADSSAPATLCRRAFSDSKLAKEEPHTRTRCPSSTITPAAIVLLGRCWAMGHASRWPGWVGGKFRRAAIFDMSILYRAATLKSSSRAVGYCYILLRRGGVVRS
jgi:hypothetical protein